MRTIRSLIAIPVTLVLGLSTPAVASERHVVASADLAKAVTGHATGQPADRAAIREALSQPQVRGVAERVGIDIARIEASVDTMRPAELAQAADSARSVNNALVGGASTVTISTTTIIIALLVLIIIIIAD